MRIIEISGGNRNQNLINIVSSKSTDFYTYCWIIIVKGISESVCIMEETARQLTGLEDMARHMMNNASTPILPLKSSAFPLNNSLPKQANHISNGFIMPTCSVSHQGSSSTGDDVSQLMDTSSTPSHSDPSSFGQGNLSKDISKDKANLRSVSPSNSKALPPLMRGPLDLTAYQRVQDRNKLEGSLGVTVFERASRDTNKRIMILHKTGNVLLVDDNEASLRHPIPSLQPSLYNKNILDKKMTEYRSLADTPQQKEINLRECDLLPQLIPEKKVNSIIKASKCFPPQVVEGNLVVVQETHKSNLTEVVKKVFGDKKEPTEVFCGGKMIKMPDPSCSETGLDKPMSIDNIPECSTSRQTLNSYEIVDDLSAFAIVSPTSTLNSDVPSPYLPSKPSQLSLYNNSTNTLPLMVCQNLTVSAEVTTLPPNFAKQIMSGKTKRDGKTELVATHKESGRTGQVHEVRRDMKAEDDEYRRAKLLLSTPIMNFLSLKESTVANRKIEQSSVSKYNADPKAPIMLCNPHFSNGSNEEIGEDSENSDPLAEMISARQGRRQQRKIVPRYGEKGYIDPEDSSNLCKATLEHVRFASETDNARSAQSVSSVSVKSNEFDPQTKLAFNTVINKNEFKAKILTAARNPPSNNKSGGSKGAESKNNSSSNKGQSSSKKGSGSSKQGVAAQFNSTPSRSPSPNKPQPSHKSDKECGDGKKSKKRAAQKKGESTRHKDERNESEQPCPEPAPSSLLVKTANLRDNEPPARPFQYISDFEESDEEVVSRSSISLSSSTDYSAPDTSADMTQKKKPRPPKSEVERLLDEPFYQEIAMLTAQTHLTDAAPCHATRSSYDTRNVSIVTRPQNNIRRGENRSNSRVTRSGNTMTNTGTTNTPQYGSRSGSGTSQRSNTATTRNESRSVSRISTNFSAPSSAHPDRLTRSSTRKATTVVVDETPRASRTTTTTSRQDSNASSHATVEASIVVTDDPTSSWRRSFRRRHNDPVSLKPVVESRRNEATGEAEEEDINVEIRMPEIVADAPVNSTTSISPDHSSVNLTKQKTSVPNISPARSESGVPPAPDQMLTKIPVRTRFCYRNSSILAGLTRSPPRDMSLLGSPFTFGNRAVISKTEKAKFQRGLSKRFCLLFKPQSPERFTNSSVFNFVNQNFTELNTSSAPVLVDNAATVNSADKRLNESATNQATPRSNLEKPKKRTTQRSNEKYSGTSKKRKTADEKASPKVVRHQEVHIPESVNTQQMYVPDHEIVREALVPEPELIQEAYVSEPKRIQQVQTPDLIPSGSGIVTRSVVKRQQDPNHTRQLYADEYSETEPSPANLVVSESNVNEEDIIHMSLDQVRASEHKKSGLDKDSNLPSRPPSDRGNSNASTHNKSFIKKHKTFRNSNPRSERHDEDDTTRHESPPPPASTLVCNSNGVSQNRNIPHPVLIENKIADPPSNAQYRLPPNSRRNSVGYGANSLNGLRQRHAHRPDPRLTQSARSRVHSVGRESSGNLADLRRKRLFYHFFKNSNHPDIVERPDPRVLPSQSIPNVPVIYFTIPSLAISDSSSQVDLLSSSQIGTKTSSQYSGPRCGLSHLNRTSRISNFHSEVPNLYQPIQSLNYRNTSPEFPVRSRICRQAPVNPARSRRYLNKLAKEADARKAQTIITTEVENVALASTMNDRNRGDGEFGDHSSVDVEDEEMDVWEAAQVAVSPAMPSFVNRQFLHEHLIITDAEYGVGNGFEQEQQIVSEDEPQIVAQVAPQIGLEDESQIVSENEPQIVSEDEPRIVSEDEPQIVSEDEPQIVSEDESEPVSENEPDLVSENEPELVNEDESIIPLPLTPQITSRRKDSENTDVSDHLLHEKRLKRTNDECRVAQMCNQNDQLLQEINNQPIGENRLNAEQQNAIDEEEREIAEEEYRADLLSRMDRFDNIITSTGQVLHVPYNPKRNRYAMMQRIVPAYRSDFPVDLADGMELEWLPMNEASTSHAFPRFSLSYILRPTNYNPDRRRTNSATPLQHVYRSRRTRNRSVSQNRVTPFIHDTRDRRLFDERRMREVPAQRRFTDGVQEESIAQNLTRYDDVTLSLLCQEEFESNNQEEFESNNQEEFESNNQGELRLVYNVDSYGNRPSSTHTESVIESHSPVIQNYSPVLSIEEHNLEMEAVSSNQETDIPPTQARDAEVTDDLEIENISANEGVQQDDVVIEEIYQDENAATVEDAHAPNQEDIIGDQESAQQIETLQPVDVIIPSIETEPELHANRLELDAAEFIPDADQIIHEQIPLIVVTEQTAPIVMPDNELEEFFLSGGSQGLTTPSVENVIQMESDPVVEAFVPEPSPFDPYETSSDDQLDVMDRLLEEIRIPANSDCETVAVPSADQNCDCQPELNGQDNLVYNDQLEAAYGEFSSGILNVETDQENEYPAITSSDRETSPEEQSILAPPTSVASSTPSSQKNVVLPQVISVSVSDQSNPHHQNNSVMMEARIGEVLNRIVNDPVFSQQLDPHAAHSSDLVRSFRATEQSNRLTGSEELCERILKSIGHLPVATIYSTQDSAAPPMSMEEVTDYSNPLGDGVSNRDENSVSNRGENSVGMTSGSSIANRDHVKKHENDNLINGDVIQEIGSHDFTLLTLNGQRSEVRDRQQLRYDIIRQEERDSIKAYELRIMEKAEHERHLRNEEEAKNNEIKRIEEEEKKKLEELARLKAEEGARLKAEEEARLKAEEEARLEAEEEARLKAEEEARLKAELQAKIQEELEADYLEHQAIEIQELRAYQIENDAHSLAYFNYVTHNTVIAEREFTHYYTERYNQLWNESMIENARISEEWYAEVDEEIRVEAERIRLEEEAKMEAERIHLEEKAKIETERIRLAEIARLKEEASLRTKAMVSTIRAARKAALRKAKLLAEKLRLDEAEKARLLAEKLKVEEAKKARLLAKKLKVEEAEKTAILIKKLKLEEAEKASIGAPKLRFEEAEKAKILAEQAEEEKSSILAAAEKIIFEEAEKVRILAEAKNAKIEEAKAQRIRVEEAEKARILAEKAYAEGIRFAEVEAEKARIAEAEADAEKARIAEARMIQETDNARKIAEEDILKRIKAKTFENYKELLAEERTLNSLDKEDTRSSPKFPKTLQNEQSSSQNLPNSGAAGFDFTSFANGSASNLRLEFYTENAHVGIVNNHAPVLLSVQSTTSKNSSKEDSPQNNSTTNESNVSSDRNTEVPAGCSMTRTLVGVGFNASSDLLKDSPRTVGLILTADGNDYVAIVSPSANDAEVNHAQTSAHEVDDRTNDVAMMLLSFSGQTPFNNGQVPNKKVLNQSNKVTAPAEVKESDIVEDIPEDDPEEDHHVEVIDKVSVNESKEDYRLRVIEPVSENEPEEDDPVKFIEPVSGDIDAIEELSQDSDVEADSLNADSDEGEYHSGVEDAFKEIDQNIRLDNTKCKSISLPDDNGDDDGDDEESHNESGDEHFDDENKRQGIALSNNNGEAEYTEPTNLVESEYICSVENGSAILLETEPANSSDGEYNSDEEQSVPVITITKPQNESERNPSTGEVYSEDNTPTIMDGAEEISLDSSIESTAVNHRIDVPHLNVMVSSPPTSFQHSMAETYVDLNKTATPSPIHLNRVLHTSIISSPAIENGSLNDDDNHTTLRNAQSVIIINAFQFNSLRSFETIDNNNPNNFSKGNNIVDESSDLKISGLESKRVLFDQYSRTIQEATRTPDASASPEMEILEEMGQLLDNDENEAQFSSYSSGGNESYDDMPTLVNSSKSPIDGHPMSGEETDRAMILAYSDRNHQITTQVNGEKVHKNKKKKYRKYIEPQDNSPHSQNLHRQIPKIKIRIVTSSCAEDDAVSVENGQISNQEAAFDENVLVVNGDACVKKIYESSIKELTAITDGLRNIRHIHIPVGATHRSLSFSDLQSLKTSAEENFLMANQMDEDNEDVPGPSKKRALNIGSDDEDTPVPRKKRAPRIASDDEEEVIRERISKPVSKKMNKIKNCKGRNNRSSSSQAAISSAIVPRRNKASDEERLPALNHISGGIPPPKDGFVMYGIYKVKVPEHYVPPAAYHGRPILQTCPKINFNAAALRKSLPKTSDIFPKTRKKIRGIKNTGNICYINSVIQCLVNLVDFKQQILKYRGVMIPKELEFELTIQFVEIMYELDLDNQSVSTKALNIEKFVTLVIKMRPKTFLKGIEGDSIEFLDFLLDNIEHQIDNYIAITGSTLVNPISLFRAQIIREEVCERCFSSEYHVDYVNALSLNAPEETGRGLVCDLLENWLFEKFKFTLERSSCAVCNHTHKFQRHHLYKLPQILILNVQRTFYHQITNNYRKSAVEAKCDVMNFYIALFLHINSPDFYYNTVFRLNSAIEHSGRTATSGHYSSLIRKNVEDWFKCDDNQISTARQPTVSQASIYFFELYNCTAEQSNEAIYHKIKKYPTMKRQILAAFGFTTPEQVRQMTENGEAMFSSRKIFDRQFISRNNLIFSN